MRLSAALLVIPACALAQAPGWLDSTPAQVFRQRVVDLALLYGASSGLDPQGFLVSARAAAADAQGCRVVDVISTRGNDLPRQDSVRSCAKDVAEHHRAGAAPARD